MAKMNFITSLVCKILLNDKLKLIKFRSIYPCNWVSIELKFGMHDNDVFTEWVNFWMS